MAYPHRVSGFRGVHDPSTTPEDALRVLQSESKTPFPKGKTDRRSVGSLPGLGSPGLLSLGKEFGVRG